MSENGALDRRQFIKTITVGTVVSSMTGKSWMGSLVGEVHAQNPGNVGTLCIKVGDYPSLATVGGSVRLGVNPVNVLSNFPEGTFYPVIINRVALSGDPQFVGLDSRCTHLDCVVEAYNAANGGSFCFCHFSTFDIRGRVLGGPALATGDLTQHVVRYDGANLVEVDVPGLGYSSSVSAISANGNVPARIRIVFPTVALVNYEVLFRQSLEGDYSPVAFSLTDSGETDQNEVAGDGQAASVYVDRKQASGFYSVAMKVAEV